MPTINGDFTFLVSPGTIVGRNAQILIRPGSAWPLSGVGTGATIQFYVNGTSVGVGTLTISAAIWSWHGMIPLAVQAGGTFTATVFAHNTGSFITIQATGSITLMLENVRPLVSIDPVQSPKGVTQLPYLCTIAGSASENNGIPYVVARVECQIAGGPFTLATPLATDWSRWTITLPAPGPGMWLIVARATDPFGGATLASTSVSVLQYQTPINDPNPKKTKNLGIPTTSSITSWTRLEPQATNADMAVSTNARLFDPLWLMTRQWQVGEFQGEDAGSPVQARVRATSAALTRCVCGELPSSSADVQAAVQLYNPMAAPLETLVERRPMRPATAADSKMLTLAVDAGLHFLRMVELNATAKKYRAAFLATYLLQQPSTTDAAAIDDPAVRFLQMNVGRAPDARRIAAAFRPTAPKIAFDPLLKITAADSNVVQQVASAWLTWYDALFAEPASVKDDAWVPPRLEYAVSVATRLSTQAQDGVTLSASEFDGGRLDWSSFDVNTVRTIDTTADRTFAPVNETTVPAPVTFPGAPAARFWEIEDSKVAYGLVPVGPTDLAHLMMIEYAGSYGNDWFVIPLTTKVGTVTRVDSLVVTDTFGVKSLVRPIGDPALPKPYFSLWQQSSRRYAGNALGAPVSNQFFLPPTIAKSIDGPVLEDVLLLRDEMANIAWGIERNIEDAIEAPVSLANGAATSNTLPAPAPNGGVPRYLLSSSVPENWIPLLPVQVRLDANGPLLSRLKRGAVLQPDGSNRVHHTESETLKSLGSALLFDEEVPREGAHLTRRRRMVRWLDGSSWVWTAFRNEIGSGEGSAGLVFDQLQDPDGGTALVAAGPPTIGTPTLSATTLTIGGPSATHTTTFNNPGAGLLNVSVQIAIVQGTTRRIVADGFFDCGSGVGVVPNGASTISGSITASNTAAAVGALVAGSATLEVQLKQGSAVVAATSVPAPITLAVNTPPSIAALAANPAAAFIGGPTTPYSITLTNPGPNRSNISVQGWVNQGATRRAAGGTILTCSGVPAGTLPAGTSTMSASISVSNSAGGVGTLVPGDATFEVQLLDNGTVLTTKTIPVSLQPNTVGIAALTTNATSIPIGSSAPYNAIVRNPGANLANVVLQGWINQGSVRHAAGGTVIMCGAGPGILPTGVFNVTFSISVSNTTGAGVFVAGPATFELQMTMNGTLLEAKTLAVTLT